MNRDECQHVFRPIPKLPRVIYRGHPRQPFICHKCGKLEYRYPK